ncbi:YeeE/YedE thiosulfate transporter family protein [Desulfohalobium retbaense]|uniref:Uncharacterized protein n=1 Tax=Desulfohalobium retbaense (strain ATCC 49708 / DSM 5692 / JCM 16813 / HR100) TaxID=485915 RepID=C8X3X1_DESRD|nr:YeeE/YedE thiosulfate transporter family protein [Desulfohalobium retbaense]ACV69118.1 protein of unknown function DUF395 YeeE/YedE [Desulfohalobium retbaense DSM 5692]
MSEIWLGLFSGIAFGFVIQRVGATNPDKMAKAHLMVESGIPRFMLLAVALSAIGLLGLQAADVGRTMIHPTSLVATGVAGVIFGVGWGLAGYCPGTCWAAAGEGRMDAIFAFLGGLAGAAAFAHVHETLIPTLYMPTNVGQITLAEVFGSPGLAVGILAVGLGICIWLIGLLWKDGGRDA